MSLYKKAEQFVVDSYTKIGRPGGIKHFLRTVYWLEQLRPDADEAFRVAAVAHDIERAFRDESVEIQVGKQGFLNREQVKHHQEKGAEIIGDFLKEQGADGDFIARVKHLVSKHEVGGDADQTLLKDVDSISFFDVNVDHFINKYKGKTTKGKMKEKFDRMYERITSRKAKEIAKPLYQKALKRL